MRPRGSTEEKERLKKNTGSQPLVLLSKVDLFAVCVDKRSGKIVKYVKLMEDNDPQWVHKLNSYASPSPIADEKNLYCHFGSFGTAALERNPEKSCGRTKRSK